jgi:hypothetical protein
VKFVVVLASLLAAAAAIAHPGGHGDEQQPHPPVTEAVAKQSAKVALGELVRLQKVPPSWAGVEVKAFERVYRSAGAAWLASFENPADKQAREIFLVLDLHGDAIAGGPALDEQTAKLRAQEELRRLTTLGRLQASWATKAAARIEKRTVGGHWEWVVGFEDATDAQHGATFVILLPYGELVAVNHSGR